MPIAFIHLIIFVIALSSSKKDKKKPWIGFHGLHKKAAGSPKRSARGVMAQFMS
jgi:hypothetical protein